MRPFGREIENRRYGHGLSVSRISEAAFCEFSACAETSQ